MFVELYNPWTVKEPRTTDLGADRTQRRESPGVQLNKIDARGQRKVIARLEVGDRRSVAAADAAHRPPPAQGDELPDPDNPIVANRPTIERVAYFVPLTGRPTRQPMTMARHR